MSNKVTVTGVNTSCLPKLSAKELSELMIKIKNGDMQARDEFAVCNMRLVLSVVQKFMNKKENVDDILKAIDNFDTSLNVKFSTYAVPMIVGEIKRFLRDNNSIRVSRSLRDTAYKALLAREELTKINPNYEPTVEEIAKKIDMRISDVAVALDAISDPMSLGDPVYSDDEDTIYLIDQISDGKDSEEKWLENINLKEGLKKLNDREKEIVMLRYYVGKTQMEISEEIGISQAQVSRLEKNALETIKNSF